MKIKSIAVTREEFGFPHVGDKCDMLVEYSDVLPGHPSKRVFTAGSLDGIKRYIEEEASRLPDSSPSLTTESYVHSDIEELGAYLKMALANGKAKI